MMCKKCSIMGWTHFELRQRDRERESSLWMPVFQNIRQQIESAYREEAESTSAE
jgi:hypothetical protein